MFQSLIVLAQGDASITLPWFAWAAIGVGMGTAIAWLAKQYKASNDAAIETISGLTRECVEALANNTASLHAVEKGVDSLARALRGEPPSGGD